MVALGVLLHAIGGFAAGTFYLPIRKIRGWSWESGWLVNGVSSWILAPAVVATLTVPHLTDVLRSVPGATLGWTYFFGVLWGVGGLTFGLSCRYLGLALGYALALGFCAFFGTIVPPIYDGRFGGLLGTASGQVLLAALGVCLAGIALCGRAGVAKERDLAATRGSVAEPEFRFLKGVMVALFAGVMSSCMSFAFRAGAPIAERAVAAGVPVLWQNTPVLVVVLLGGFTTNAAWCVILNIKNRSAGDYLGRGEGPVAWNYFLATVAGVTWYLQFMFYGMGTTKMGAYDFSSWTLHMAFIIVFSNLWALRLGEWTEASPRTRGLLIAGIGVVLASTVMVGLSNGMAAVAPR
ncbi:MAG: L-rhamnose/proton symporter RhaT [Verrucomicrobiales bacterium]|nr:L-rhamnose/proton symporter RhaT [Verrucomicrobiales bacterium]